MTSEAERERVRGELEADEGGEAITPDNPNERLSSGSDCASDMRFE